MAEMKTNNEIIQSKTLSERRVLGFDSLFFSLRNLMRFSRSIYRMFSTLRTTSLHTCPGRRACSSENTGIVYLCFFFFNGKWGILFWIKQYFSNDLWIKYIWQPASAFLPFLLCYPFNRMLFMLNFLLLFVWKIGTNYPARSFLSWISILPASLLRLLL